MLLPVVEAVAAADDAITESADAEDAIAESADAGDAIAEGVDVAAGEQGKGVPNQHLKEL